MITRRAPSTDVILYKHGRAAGFVIKIWYKVYAVHVHDKEIRRLVSSRGILTYIPSCRGRDNSVIVERLVFMCALVKLIRLVIVVELNAIVILYCYYRKRSGVYIVK